MTKDIPAFPCEYDTFATLKDGTTLNVPVKASSAGMSLRDYFAAKALPSMLDELYAISRNNRVKFENIYKHAADASYEIADAMLAAREGK